MNLIKDNLVIRNAMSSDAVRLCAWWNNGEIMAHAGFPNGTGDTPERIRESLVTDNDDTHRRHIIEYEGKPIGEMNYRNKGSGIAEIGIKICDFTRQEQGLGTTLLSMFINALFTYYGYEKICLDTNAKNKRAQHVYENKLGFKVKATHENSWRDQLGEMQSSIDYELTKEDWLAKKQEPLEYIHIRQEKEHDRYIVEELTREAFWCNNWDITPEVTDVHLLVHRLRKSPSLVPELNLVVELNSIIVGHIIYTKSKVVDDTDKEYEMLTFGPLSVHPKYQGRGIGKALIRHSFKAAKELSHKAVIIFGHPDYYPRIGFQPAVEFGITTADGANFDPFMVYPLYDGAIDGIKGKYYIDPVYDTLTPEDANEFDKKFPPKAFYTPPSIDILLDRLELTARESIKSLGCKTLTMLSTKSEREMSAITGIDTAALETIRQVMKENFVKWGRS